MMGAYHDTWSLVHKKTKSVATQEETNQLMVFASPEAAYKALFSINKTRQNDFEIFHNRVTLPWRD